MESEQNKTQYVKYPRTFHLPFSQSNSSDDVWWKDCSLFEGKEVVISEKIDGESCSIYPDGHVHARSLDTDNHPSRTWIKRMAGEFSFNIPANHRICGENVYAYHSIFYTDLPSYFLAFGIYDGNNNCLSWQETEDICEILGLHTVPVIYKGIWSEKLIRNLWTGKGAYPTYRTSELQPEFPKDFVPCDAEGYVVRFAESFHYDQFSKSCAKMVRKNHVTTDQHWMERKPVPNLLK